MMKRLLLSTTIFLFVFGLFNTVSAQGFDLIICDGRAPDACTFADLVELAQNVITALILLSSFFAVIAFIYAGFLLLTSGGNEAQKTKAKEIFKKVLIGYLWILAAWLIVYTITSLLDNRFSLLTP